MSAKLGLSALFLSCIFLVVGAQKNSFTDPTKKPLIAAALQGRWTNEADSNAVMVIGKKNFTSYYQNAVLEKGSYLLSFSCNERNKLDSKIRTLDKSVFFLMKTGYAGPFCYELLSLTEVTLSWIEPINGKIFVFTRSAKK